MATPNYGYEKRQKELAKKKKKEDKLKAKSERKLGESAQLEAHPHEGIEPEGGSAESDADPAA